ncbi:MAG: hypothetical protein JWO43_167 [Candidatus Adlerbacteria bacterium]|nr:hypothetical protein [Candidatus Adlerbacteria bacterium]
MNTALANPPTEQVGNSESKLEYLPLANKDVVVRFIFTNARYLPAGLREGKREEVRLMNNRHMNDKYTGGDQSLAEVGRLREGHVDTGRQVIDNLKGVSAVEFWDDMQRVGYHMCHAMYFKEFQPGKSKKSRSDDNPNEVKEKFKYTIVLHFSRTGELLRLTKEQRNSLEAFFEGCLWTCHIWENPELNPHTINFVQIQPGINPDYELVVINNAITCVEPDR